MVTSVDVANGSNSSRMDWRYLRWEAQSCTSSWWYWESLLSFFQMLSTNNLDFPKFFRRKALNSIQVMGVSSSSQWQHLYTNVHTEKRSCKGNRVSPGGPNGFKIIFALLIEVIAVYIQLIIIYLRYFSLKGSLALRQWLSRSLVCLQVGLHKLLELIIGSRQSKSWSGNRSRSWSGVTRRSRAWRKRGTTRREVPARGTTRTGSSKSHLGRWLDWIGE